MEILEGLLRGLPFIDPMALCFGPHNLSRPSALFTVQGVKGTIQEFNAFIATGGRY
jgi:hypothetical protein